MSQKLGLMGSGASYTQKERIPETITHKISETKSSFHGK